MSDPTEPTPQPPVTRSFIDHEFVVWFRRSFGGSLITALIAAGGTSLVAWRALAQEARGGAGAT